MGRGSLEEYGSWSAKFERVRKRKAFSPVPTNESREWAQMAFQVPPTINSAIYHDVEENDERSMPPNGTSIVMSMINAQLGRVCWPLQIERNPN